MVALLTRVTSTFMLEPAAFESLAELIFRSSISVWSTPLVVYSKLPFRSLMPWNEVEFAIRSML